MTETAEKFVTPCDLPNARQRELLECLIEECSEVQKRCTKALRFGLDEVQPGQSLDNATRLAHEVGDVECVLGLLVSERMIDLSDIKEGHIRKDSQLAKYLQTEPSNA